jgi:Flp pilus assembly protein TadD
MRVVVFSLLLFLSACASVEHAPTNNISTMLRDDRFAASKIEIDTSQIFALNEDMHRYLEKQFAAQTLQKGVPKGLFDVLYDKGQLKVEYNADYTRNAAETFAARSGNCLSLAIMTGAFAKAMGLNVVYQRVLVEDHWNHYRDLIFISEHVNIVLGASTSRARFAPDDARRHTIDFFPPADQRPRTTETLDENTVIAMYLNNRAAEELAQGHTEKAYWWVRKALLQDAQLNAAYNTLGVIYRRHGALNDAERVFNAMLARDRNNEVAQWNLAVVLRAQGRVVDADTIAERLQRALPHPPHDFYDRGQAALRAGEYETAKQWFAREVARAGYNPKFHFALAVAHFHLGEFDQVNLHLRKALDGSATQSDRAIYAGKLEALATLRK